MAQIFISYASADRDRARVLAERLGAQGLSVWWDRTIPPGRVFDEVIQQALNDAGCVIVLWSNASVRSNWVKTEAAEAVAHDRLLPALIEDVAPPIEFKRIQAANLVGWDGDADHPEYRNLLASVHQLIARPRGQVDRSAAASSAAPAYTSRPSPSPPSSRMPLMLVVAAILAVAIGGALYFVKQRAPGALSPPIEPPANHAAATPPAASEPAAPAPPAVSAPPAAATSPPSAAPSKGRINLLAPENGGQLIVAATEKWNLLIDGKDDSGTYVDSGIGVFGFADGQAATFDTFTMLIPVSADVNVKDFELLAGNDGPTGKFDLIGKFTAQNIRVMRQPFQEFHFAPVKAKFLKFHALVNQNNSGGAIYAYEFQLFGKLE